MSNFWEKNIRRSREEIASVGQPAEDTASWTRARIESFVKGFGLSQPATRQIVDAWMADARRSYDEGWESHADTDSYNEN